MQQDQDQAAMRQGAAEIASKHASVMRSIADTLRRLATQLREHANTEKFFAFVVRREDGFPHVGVIKNGEEPSIVNVRYESVSPNLLLGVSDYRIALNTQANYREMAEDFLSSDDDLPAINGLVYVLHIADLCEWRAAVLDREAEIASQISEATTQRDTPRVLTLVEQALNMQTGDESTNAGLEPFRVLSPVAAVH